MLDLLDNRLGTFLGDIVDDYIGTQLSKHQSVASPKSSSGTGDDDSLTLEVDSRRCLLVCGSLSLLQETLRVSIDPPSYVETYHHVDIFRVDGMLGAVKVPDFMPFGSDRRGGKGIVCLPDCSL